MKSYSRYLVAAVLILCSGCQTPSTGSSNGPGNQSLGGGGLFAPPDVDSDNDGLLDSEELRIGTDPQLADSDGDSLSDGAEILQHGTDPLQSDTDFDGLTDSEEIQVYGTNPLLFDSDLDGLSDGLEFDPLFLSDPLNPDTDGDTILDGDEIDFYLDLLIPNKIGTVWQNYCSDYISVLGFPAIGDVSVFEDFSGLGFAGWLATDRIAVGNSGFTLANLRNGQHRATAWQGVHYGDTYLADRAINGSWVKISTGAYLNVGFGDQLEVSLWLLYADLVVVAPSSGASGWLLLNVDRCQMVSVN